MQSINYINPDYALELCDEPWKWDQW